MCIGRHRQLVGIVATIILVMLLTACSIGGVGSAPSATATPLPQATAALPPTATVPPTATPFFVNGVAYQRVTDSMSGFSFAIPADARFLMTNPLPLGVVGDSVTWSDADSNQSHGLDVDFGSATGDAAPQCPQAIPVATVVDVGSGLKGYQSGSLVLGPLPQGAVAIPKISVSFVVHGVVIDIQLDLATHGDFSNLVERYGPIWQEMLASFQSGTVVNPTPPCGS